MLVSNHVHGQLKTVILTFKLRFSREWWNNTIFTLKMHSGSNILKQSNILLD